jgi:capsular exopolysaccharide synthesis family protein
MLASCAFALAFAWLSFRKETIRSESDIETKLEARALGIIYADGDRNPIRDLWNRYIRKKKNRLLVTELTAKFDFVEHFKKISAHIAGQAQKNGAKVILVTSVREHEGKSTVSANLALSLAQQSHQVLLIDGDMRRPTQQALFLGQGAELKATLGDLLLGKSNLTETLYYDEKRGIYLLLNERNFSNSTDIVSSENMTRLLEVVRKAFDYIIIDSPPMALMADAEVLADRADMSILVIHYDMVVAPDLNDAIDALRDCHGEFAGCILNNVHTLPGERRTVVGYGGYGRYGKYGHYGKYGRYGHYGQYGQYGHYEKDDAASQ